MMMREGASYSNSDLSEDALRNVFLELQVAALVELVE